jgi:hypothetical protein
VNSSGIDHSNSDRQALRCNKTYNQFVYATCYTPTILLQILPHAGANKRSAAEQPEATGKPVKRAKRATASAATGTAANDVGVKVEAIPAKTVAKTRVKGSNGIARAAHKTITAIETAPLARKPPTASIATRSGKPA